MSGNYFLWIYVNHNNKEFSIGAQASVSQLRKIAERDAPKGFLALELANKLTKDQSLTMKEQIITTYESVGYKEVKRTHHYVT